MAKDKTKKENPFTARIVPHFQSSIPTYINYSRFSHIASDVIMDVGILDDDALRAAIAASPTAPETPPEVPAYIVHRIGMSITTFMQLRSGVEEIWKKLKASGLPEKLGIEE